MHLAPFEEMLKGLTDLPISLLSAVLGCLLLHKKADDWKKIFFLTAAASLMGAILHIFIIEKPIAFALWCLLYALLFELVRRLGRTLVNAAYGKKLCERKITLAVEAVLFSASVVLCLAESPADIYAFAVFAALILFNLFAVIIKLGRLPQGGPAFFGMLGAAVLLQLLKDVILYGVVINHVVIFATLFSAYRFALKNPSPTSAIPQSDNN